MQEHHELAAQGGGTHADRDARRLHASRRVHQVVPDVNVRRGIRRCTSSGSPAIYHDSAAALVKDGGIVAAAQEERFTAEEARLPVSPRRPSPTASRRKGSPPPDLACVTFYDKPFIKFERILETYLAYAPRGHPVVPHGHAALAEGEALDSVS